MATDARKPGGCGPKCWTGVGRIEHKGEVIEPALYGGLPVRCRLCPSSPTYWRLGPAGGPGTPATTEPPTEPDMLAAALRYAAYGWPVLPVWWTPEPGVCACPHGAADTLPAQGDGGRGERHSRGKHPITRHGVKDATTDPATIRAWWSRWPRANIGIATGAPGPDVLDVDVRDGKPGMASHDRLRAAGLLRGVIAVVTTGSGGRHLYYPGTAQRDGAIPRAGIDFRSTGGYVIAPPSTVDGRPYVAGISRPISEGRPVDWQAIRDFLAPPPPVTTADHDRPALDPADPLARWAAAELERVLAGGPVSRRDTTRSGIFYEMVGLARKAGMTQEQAVAALTPWCERHGKYVGRVEREVARAWSKRAGVAA